MQANRYGLIVLLFLCLTSIASAQTYNFDTCGAEGRLGPNSCDYNGDNSVNVQGNGVQRWDIPQEGLYRVTAVGAQGGDAEGNTGGYGAEITTDLQLSGTINIIVGQEGYGERNNGGSAQNAGGGGGTFIYDSATDSNPIVAAGGGGGGGNTGNENARTSTSGRDGGGGGSGGSSGGAGDTDDSGSYHGGTGAGWDEDGFGHNQCSYDVEGGDSPRNGAEGGQGKASGGDDVIPGGFGGGGGGSGACGSDSSGGGGGYSGGGVDIGCGTVSAGGGGSYDSGDRVSSSVSNTGNGYVEIELLQACEASFNDPVIQSTGYSDSQASSSSPASFDTDVSVNIDSSYTDPCGTTYSNSLTSCSVTATGEEGGSYSPSASVSGDTCEFTVENDGNSAWGPGEEVTLDISVTDGAGNTDSLTDTYSFVDTDVNEISVNSPSDNADGVFGFDSGVDLEFSVTDYEAKTTNRDLSVDILGDSLQNIGTQTVSNGDGTVSVVWERDGEYGDTGMYGFKRGNSYDWTVDVAYASSDTDIGGNSGDPWTFTVENPPNINGLTPTDGAQSSGLSVQELQNTISVNQMEVEFYLGALGTSSYNIEGTDTVLGSSGAASTNIMDSVQSGDEYEWFIGVDDGHSYIKYDSRVNTFTAPEVLRSATDLYVLPTERPSRDALNSLESGDESYIWVDNGKLHWVDPATGTERWLQFAQSLSETTVPSGAIWVDGENLVWVGEDTTRYQHVGTNDGSSSLDPGTFWVDSSGYLRYVDGNGNERVMNG